MGGVVIEKYPDRFEFSNPGMLLVSMEQLLHGNVSECRNKTLQTMFTLLGAAEKAGSGVDKIRRGWELQHWRLPRVNEQMQPDVHNGDNFAHNGSITHDHWQYLQQVAASAQQRQRLEPMVMESLILQLCKDDWLSKRQLGALLKRNVMTKASRTERSRWFAPADGDAWIMGVLNCTPDSFSDGGMYASYEDAVRHAEDMWKAGAAIVDVGGESTRPGSEAVQEAEELARVIPVIEALHKKDIPVSIDTSKAEVMRRAIAAGACMVNDVTALGGDAESMGVVAASGVDVCLMHMQGTPTTMQNDVHYHDVVDDVVAFFESRVAACLEAGIGEGAILLDPGIGFGKRLEDNLALIAAIPRLKQLGFPVLLGVSRKSFLGALTGASVNDREIETAAAVTACIYAGADMVRVHDVPAQAKAVKTASAIRRCLPESTPDVASWP